VKYFNILLIAMLALLGACSDGPRALSTPGAIQAVAELPPPERMDLLADSRPYLIGPFDRLTINVFGIDDLSNIETQVDASGRMSFPLAGTVDAAGKTPGELETELGNRLRGRFIRDPQVTVNLKETVSQVVTVDGEVAAPGLYPVIGKMTLMRAIAVAKGSKEFARLDDVVVFRTVNGQKMGAVYNLKSIRQGIYADPEVFANDVVVVGNSAARRAVKDAITALPSLLGTLILRF
jgi:polysaccharide biosynthesis/export protein